MKLSRTIPAFPVRDISQGVAFYRDRLGFTPRHQDDTFAVLTRDEAELHLWAARDESWSHRAPEGWELPIQSGAESFLAGTHSCRIRVDGIDELFLEYRDAGVLYAPDTTIQERPWGERDFPALDLHRNLLTFFEPLPRS